MVMLHMAASMMNGMSALILVMVWGKTGDKLLHEMIQFYIWNH